MLDRLQYVKQRFDEVSDLIIQPDVIADQKRYVQLNKEYKDLKALVDKREEYINLDGNIKEANEIIADGSDAEMVEMAKMQLDEAQERLPQLEEEIKVPENLNSVLRYYQKTGFKWLKILDRYHFGGILADDMGLRKNYSNVISNS